MSEGTKIKNSQALILAQALLMHLSGVCQRVEIAGSLRRGREMVGDIEIVCVPNQVVDLFGVTSYLWADVRDALAMFKMVKGGDHYQQYDLSTCKADVFVTSLEQWGVIFTLRTGSANFSRKLVTPKTYGGLMPDGMFIQDGHLWRRSVSVETVELIETREEGDLFNAIGIQWVKPEAR